MRKRAVYELRPSARARGHDLTKPRYAVVVQSDEFMHLSTWFVVPTSTSGQPNGFRPEIIVKGMPTVAMCDHLMALDPQQRLGDLVGYVTWAEMAAIERGVRLLMGTDLETTRVPPQHRP